jgi:hemolysin III
VPLLEESLDYEKVEQKPTWRGWIHAATAPIALRAAAKWSSAVFALTSLLMFGTSAVYHRFDWSPKVRRTLKRLDHANIFLLIAGTYTPIAVLCLPMDRAVLLLSLVWSGALLGIGFRVFWINAPRWLYVPLYVLLGWAAVMYLADLFQANVATMVLVIAGGLLYTIGAVIYGLKRPNPVPGHFGFHEIFHTLTVLAFLCHWTGILLVAVDPPLHG